MIKLENWINDELYYFTINGIRFRGLPKEIEEIEKKGKEIIRLYTENKADINKIYFPYTKALKTLPDGWHGKTIYTTLVDPSLSCFYDFYMEEKKYYGFLKDEKDEKYEKVNILLEMEDSYVVEKQMDGFCHFQYSIVEKEKISDLFTEVCAVKNFAKKQEKEEKEKKESKEKKEYRTENIEISECGNKIRYLKFIYMDEDKEGSDKSLFEEAKNLINELEEIREKRK